MQATYTPGHGELVTGFMARRSAPSHAAFVLPFLGKDFQVLDLGCGPGSITTDLAARVPAGSVLGVDMNEEQVVRARQRARERGLANVEFAVMSVEVADLPSDAFDLVFAHALFEHLPQPLDALSRILPCLKPGGIIALRSPDWGGLVVHPEGPGLAAALAACEHLQRKNGGNLRAGRHLASWLARAGFEAVGRSASYEIYDDPGCIAAYLAGQLESAGNRDLGDSLRTWAQASGALFAQPWFEAIGRRPDSRDPGKTTDSERQGGSTP